MSKIEYAELKKIINNIITDQNIGITDLGVSEDNFNGSEPCFDMALIKFLAGSNTGGKGCTKSHQSSILLTGEQESIFPVLKREEFYGQQIGKMRVMKLPIKIMENNLNYLNGKDYTMENKVLETWITTNETTGNRVEAGCKTIDGNDYNNFYESLTSNCIIIILKLMSEFNYAVLGIKFEDIEKYLGNIQIDDDSKYYMFELGRLSSSKCDDITFIEPGNIQDVNEDVPFNRLVAGAPGTGKSKFIDEERKKYFTKNYERVTFYPDYTYGQFVGMYKPSMNGTKIEYKFIPGPFLRLYTKAIRNKDKNYLLIIEEINRGNAASIFGDMFQLIDRDEDGNGEYSVSISEDIKKYLNAELGEDVNEIKLPNNLYIWATMNTADQGVYPLDSAFKRRFDEYKFMKINENDSVIENYNVNIKCNKIGEIKWNAFRRILNKYLISLDIAEDKLIGPFFIKPSVLSDSKKFENAFSDKLIMYLMEDVLKHRKNKLFLSSSLTKVINDYEEEKDIFSDKFMQTLEAGNSNE